MIDNTSYLLIKQHVKAGEKVKVWSGLLLDWFNGPKAPDFPEDGLFTLYEIVTEDNRHGGWHWEIEKEEENGKL